MRRRQGTAWSGWLVSLLLVTLLPACRFPAPPAEPKADEPSAPVRRGVVPGRVLRVNADQGFVILQCESLILQDETLKVIRGTEAVGELRVTGPLRMPYAAADITAGEPRRGDLVERERVRPAELPTNKGEP